MTDDKLEYILEKVSQIDAVVAAQRRQEVVLEKLTDAVSKLAVIEERQNNFHTSVQRLFSAIESLEARVRVLEHDEVLNSRVRYAVISGVGVVLASLLYAVLRLLGLTNG